MLGTGDLIAFQSVMNLGRQVNLDTFVTGLNAVRCAVVQGNPIWNNIVGV